MKANILVFRLTCFIFASLLVFTPMVMAADTATVTATVTVQNISVTVADGTVAYGTLANNATADTNPADTQTATNNGNVAEDFYIKGQDTANWTLAGTAGADQYVHMFCVSSCGTPVTNYTALTTSNQALGAGSVATSGTQTFDLYINTPNPSSVYTEQSVNVTITATTDS